MAGPALFDVFRSKHHDASMLIICSGPDTYRAMRKAQELEAAFRAKYDPSGTSIERFSSAKEAAEQIPEKANSMSLFSPRRFFRVRGLLEDLPKTAQKPLAAALSKDQEHVIVVTVEEKPPSKTTLSPFKEVKIVSYDFDELEGKAWTDWVLKEATRLGVQDASWVLGLSRMNPGDGWFVVGELQKAAAAGPVPLAGIPNPQNAFERADAFVQRLPGRHRHIAEDGAVEGMCNILLSSCRSALRVRDGASEGLHPYVRQKLQRMRLPDIEGAFAAVMVALIASRTSLAREPESSALFP